MRGIPGSPKGRFAQDCRGQEKIAGYSVGVYRVELKRDHGGAELARGAHQAGQPVASFRGEVSFAKQPVPGGGTRWTGF